ncbi:MAG: hypothetical protein M1828_006592 [Chrysothrix sp. TS-e1954]|nr:MAG: hypothetical protein M1828_006592 [Chrysothrix sp. TS-e1954]
MAPAGRPQHHIDLGGLPPPLQGQSRSESSTAASSPGETPTTASGRHGSQSETPGSATLSNAATAARRSAGSPSNEGGNGSRFYPRRARELQSEASSRSMWGPPVASGLSTPLRETIPESPGDDTFPDLGTSSNDTNGLSRSLSSRRSRAGTVPSQFPPVGSQQPSSNKSSARPTPSTSPFRAPATAMPTLGRSNSSSSTTGKSALLNRIRAGSLPQRSNPMGNQSPFGPSIFSTNWNAARDRANSYTGGHSRDPSSPPSGFPRDLADSDVKTLDYLGLVDGPQQTRSMEAGSQESLSRRASAVPSILANLSSLNRANRFRSYSVNAKEKYAADEDEEQGNYSPYYSGTITPSPQAAAAALAATQAQIHQHNLDVQAFANQASSSRPRARTAGVLDSPSSRMWRSYMPTPSRLYASSTASDFMGEESGEYSGLNDAVRAMQLQSSSRASFSMGGEGEGETFADATRALWLGGVPSSTTSSSLKVIFEPFGKIESARVLTHKSCGFVNFESVQHAITAKSQLNGKELFPGSGPIRIGYAKAPSSAGTPGGNDAFPSPSPDPFARPSVPSGINESSRGPSFSQQGGANAAPNTESALDLRDIKPEIMQIVDELGAGEEDQVRIAAIVDRAIALGRHESEIPPVPEASQGRVYDAQRLREVRKRIDNASCTVQEIEDIALSMLPEIAELSSDYLGNTVVQKLFEFCSEDVKEAMLQEVAPRLAEVGVHKNGTWAAQKIIDVARTPTQIATIVDALKPYGMACFLDQYGNYVMQCCLRFSAPYNNFLFEAMLSRLWPIAQGRFGARAMRACLESHHSTKDQQRMLAAAIALHSVQLCCNQNAALLLTWFLDTCNFPHRRRVLAPRLAPHLVQLCTHKVAYLTVLKIINQKGEPDARDTMLQALFFSENGSVLEDILKDQTCGATLIFKVLTTPFLEDPMRAKVIESVREVLLRIKATAAQGYKRLMDEVGLSTRGSVSGRDSSHNNRDGSEVRRQSSNSSLPQVSPFDRQVNGAYMSPGAGQPFNAGMSGGPQRAQSFDVNMYDQFGANGVAGTGSQMFPSHMSTASPISQQNQIQYQQAMFAAGRSPGYFSGVPTGNFPGNPMSPMDAYRNMNQNRMVSPHAMGAPSMQQGAFSPQFSPMNTGSPRGWQQQQQQQQQQQYNNQYMMSQQQGQAMMGGNGQRGRR